MARRKKNNDVVSDQIKIEVDMSEDASLETVQTELDLARAELEKTRIEIEEKKKELANREYSKQEIEISQRQIKTINRKKAGEGVIEKQKAYDNQMVNGTFLNRRAPGQPVKLTYNKYVDDPVKWYFFEDGKTYTIPRGFADQINEHYYTPHFIQKQGDMDPSAPSSAIHEVDTSNKKYAFFIQAA